MVPYNGQLDDPEAMERAYSQLDHAYDHIPVEIEGMDEFLGILDDLVWDDPDLGTSLSLQISRTKSRQYSERIDDTRADSDISRALDRIEQQADRELSRNPSQGTKRHYDLDTQLRTL